MKKFLSMVMAAAMVVSLVPATAFAATGDFKATAKVIDAQNFPVDDVDSPIGGSELQLTLTTGDSLRTQDKMKFTVTLDNVKDLTGYHKNQQSKMLQNKMLISCRISVHYVQFQISYNICNKRCNPYGINNRFAFPLSHIITSVSCQHSKSNHAECYHGNS